MVINDVCPYGLFHLFFKGKNMFITYVIRFALRIIVLVIGMILYIKAPELLDIDNFDFFSSFSVMHLFWLFLLATLFFSYIPKAKVSIGSLKNSRKYYSSIDYNVAELEEYKAKTDKKAIVVALIWIVFNTPFWILYLLKIISSKELLILVLLFAVADLFCVLIFCPFQLFFRNKCCTTCRIFLWDHIFLVSPLIVVPGFFSKSLIIIAAILVIIWEIQWHRHPEYFWEGSNKNLQCNTCKDKICTIKKPIYK